MLIDALVWIAAHGAVASLALCVGCADPDPSVAGGHSTASSSSSEGAWSAAVPSANALRRIVDLATHEVTTIDSIARVLGPAKHSSTQPSAYELSGPFDDVDTVVLLHHSNQNREFLDDAILTFRAGALPSVRSVADRLGIPLAEGSVDVENSCFDARCPTVTLTYPIDGSERGLRIHLRVDDSRHRSDGEPGDSPPRTGAVDARSLPVRELRFSILETRCPIGKAVAAPTAMPAPANEVQKRLATALLEGARVLSHETVDMAALESALGVTLPRAVKCCPRQEVAVRPGPHARLVGASFFVTFEQNSSSKFTWVQYIARDRSVAPFDLPGLTYVVDPKLICRIRGDGSHLWELHSEGAFRTFVVVSTSEELPSRRRYVTSISLERSPADWPHRVF